MIVLAIVKVIGKRHGVLEIGSSCAVLKRDEFIRLRNRQRPQQEIIEDAEDRSINAYAEAERKHGYGGECRAAP